MYAKMFSLQEIHILLFVAKKAILKINIIPQGCIYIFSDFICTWETQNKIRELVLESINLKKLFESINDDTDIYDSVLCRKNPNGLAMVYSTRPNQNNKYRPKL